MSQPKIKYAGKTPEDRFFEKIQVLTCNCWFWLPTHRDSTGRPRYRQQDAGQWAWLHFKGPYDPKVNGERSHTCLGGKDCVNPNHMVLEPHKTNTQRGPFRGKDKSPRKPGRWL